MHMSKKYEAEALSLMAGWQSECCRVLVAVPADTEVLGGVLGGHPQQLRHRALCRACQQGYLFLGKGRWGGPQTTEHKPRAE